MNRKVIISLSFLMFGIVHLSAQKDISSGSIRTEIKDNYTIYWQKTSTEKRLKLLDGHYRINYTNEYIIGTFEKGIPMDTLRSYLKDNDILQKEHVFDKQGLKHGRQLTFHENGQRASEAMYVHGKVDGLYREWYGNGNRKIAVEMIDGVQTGLFTTWHEDGKMLGEIQLKDGMKNGKCQTWIYAHNETFLNEEHYKNDQLVDTTHFYRVENDGRRVLRSLTAYDENSALQSFDSYDGDTHCHMDYVGGKLQLMTQHTRGQLTARTEYKNDVQHGDFVLYYPGSTQVWKSGRYLNGALVFQNEYSTDGKLIHTQGTKPEETEAE